MSIRVSRREVFPRLPLGLLLEIGRGLNDQRGGGMRESLALWAPGTTEVSAGEGSR